jgi:hypothetical protein
MFRAKVVEKMKTHNFLHSYILHPVVYVKFSINHSNSTLQSITDMLECR